MRHVIDECPVCGPAVHTEAYHRGVARAEEARRRAEDGE